MSTVIENAANTAQTSVKRGDSEAYRACLQNLPASQPGVPMPEYEREGIVEEWLRVYEVEKERAFIECLDRHLPKDHSTLLDVGCGTGFHTFLWSERGRRVTAADYSTRFRDHILRRYQFPFIWTDILKCNIQDRFDICFCMAITTILLDEPQRFQTFETLKQLVRPGGSVVLVSCSNQRIFGRLSDGAILHCLDRRDLEKLRSLGFEIKHVFFWSSSPRILWRRRGFKWLGKAIEACGRRFGVGARKIVICRRGTC